ncbi:2744_t:CDS:2, partial [Scutellospora calospora]
KTAQTFTKALNVIKNILLSEAFRECKPTIGLQVIITDDYAESIKLQHRDSYGIENIKIGLKEDIEVVNSDLMIFKHRSSKNKDLCYFVNIQLRICECSLTEALCKHQSSITIYYIELITNINNNYFVNNVDDKNRYGYMNNKNIPLKFLSVPLSDYKNDINNNNISEKNSNIDQQQLAINELDWFSNDLKNLLKEDNPALEKSIYKFVNIYKKYHSIQDTQVHPAITSFFEIYDYNVSHVNSNSYQCREKRIKVQVAATSRQKKRSTHELKKMQ